MNKIQLYILTQEYTLVFGYTVEFYSCFQCIHANTVDVSQNATQFEISVTLFTKCIQHFVFIKYDWKVVHHSFCPTFIH